MMENDLKALLPLLDLVLEPLKTQLSQLNAKIDQVVHLGEKVATAEAADRRHDVRLDSIENIQAQHAIELAQARGINKVIVWILALFGAPLVVVLAGAGILSILKIGS